MEIDWLQVVLVGAAIVGFVVVIFGIGLVSKFSSPNVQTISVGKGEIKLAVNQAVLVIIVGLVLALGGASGLWYRVVNSGEKVTDNQINSIVTAIVDNETRFLLNMPPEILSIPKDDRPKKVNVTLHNLTTSRPTKIYSGSIDFDYQGDNKQMQVRVTGLRKGDQFYFEVDVTPEPNKPAIEFRAETIVIPASFSVNLTSK